MTPTTSSKGGSRRLRWLLAIGVLILAGVGGGLFGLHWWTRHQLSVAKELLADLRFEEAARLLDDYLRIRPADADAHLLAAQARRRAGNADAAEHHLNECDRLQGQTSESSLEGVLLLAERGALADKELWLQSRLEEHNAASVVLLEALARDFLITGRHEEAMDVIAELLKARPAHHRALTWRAQIWGGQHKWGAALDDAGQAVELDPDSQEARLILAEANEHIGQTDVAVREYAWLYEHGSKEPAVVLGLGRCWQDLARFADARQVLDAFLAEQPARADVLVERGRLALREQGTTQAEPYFRRAAAADPNNLAAHRFLFRCLKAGGNSEECARVEGQLRKLETREGRIDQLFSAVRSAPEETEPRYQLGLYLLQNGREKDGREFLNGVLRFNPGHEPARAALAAYAQRTARRPGEGEKQ